MLRRVACPAELLAVADEEDEGGGKIWLVLLYTGGSLMPWKPTAMLYGGGSGLYVASIGLVIPEWLPPEYWAS